ncbi:MAG: hypothetical protein WD021_01345 [Rhodothermales bacterium]
MSVETSVYAVLTGDITASSRLPPKEREKLPEMLRRTAGAARDHFAPAVCHPIDIFRGDSWQLLVERPALALRIAVFMRAALRSTYDSADIDTRVAIGFGTVDFVPDHDISGGDGEAFRLSGGAIDAMERDVRMAIAAGRALPRSTTVSLDAVARLVDLQITRWTRRQAFAVSRAVLGRTQQQIGDEWVDRPITQQSVAQHLTAAGWHAIEYAARVSETIFERVHDDPTL